MQSSSRAQRLCPSCGSHATITQAAASSELTSGQIPQDNKSKSKETESFKKMCGCSSDCSPHRAVLLQAIARRITVIRIDIENLLVQGRAFHADAKISGLAVNSRLHQAQRLLVEARHVNDFMLVRLGIRGQRGEKDEIPLDFLSEESRIEAVIKDIIKQSSRQASVKSFADNSHRFDGPEQPSATDAQTPTPSPSAPNSQASPGPVSQGSALSLSSNESASQAPVASSSSAAAAQVDELNGEFEGLDIQAQDLSHIEEDDDGEVVENLEDEVVALSDDEIGQE
jgi:hypothetical protein